MMSSAGMREPLALRVLRLCSVFEPAPGPVSGAAARYDPIGGMQNHTAELTRGLDRLGARQTVLTSRLAAAAGIQPYEQRARVVRVGLPMPWLRQLWAPAAVLPALNGAVDLVHAHQGEDLAVLPLAVAAAHRHRCPLVVTLHCSVRHTLRVSDPRTALLKHLGGLFERWALPQAAAVITLTRTAAARVRADGVPAQRIHVIPSGVDPALFDGQPADPFPDLPHPRVAYVGRLAPQKRVTDLLLAFAALRTPDVHLLIVGDGPERARLERMAATSPARPRMHFTGFVRHEQVPAVLAHADVLALPSAYEELGSVLLEGMRAALPIVATRVGGIPEALGGGETGLLVPPADPPALAAAIDRLLGDPALAATLAAAARRRADRYAWPALTLQVLRVYDQVLRGGT